MTRRLYSSYGGRFLSEDPMGFRASDTNLYRYVDNGPTNHTDPSGDFPDPWGYRWLRCRCRLLGVQLLYRQVVARNMRARDPGGDGVRAAAGGYFVSEFVLYAIELFTGVQFSGWFVAYTQLLVGVSTGSKIGDIIQA